MKILKWLYQKDGIYRNVYMLITLYIRMPFSSLEKSRKMINEHINW